MMQYRKVSVDATPVVESLEKVLADTYTLYLKTHNYHWNVTGPMFVSLHSLFETQYTELALAVDTIAERIRALGSLAAASYSEFGKLTSISTDDPILTAAQMVGSLCDANELVIRTVRQAILIAETGEDFVTSDLLTQRMQTHEKSVWMLKSLMA